METNNSSGNTKGKALAREIREWVEIFIKSLCVVIILFTLVFRVVTVSGSSMRETLHDKDKLIVSNLCYTPTKGDVVILRADAFGDEALVKRVIATEGDEVDIDFETWSVYVNGTKLDESYVNYENGLAMMNSGAMSYPFTVEQGKMFVMGDNRNHSSDGRAFGTVDVRECIGKVYFRFLPVNSFGVIK